MTDDQQRHVRLRLARRRPAPGRVRARVRDEEPTPTAEPDSEPQTPTTEPDGEPQTPTTEPDGEPQRRSLRERLASMPWMHGLTLTGTVIAIVAGIAGLWFQAVATYWSQQTSRDQLQQSKEDGERKEREQASRVNFWQEGGFRTARRTVHVVNRSSDPVTAVILDVLLLDNHPGTYADFETDIPPCTEEVFNAGVQVNPHSSSTPETDVSWLVADLMFVDKNGQAWKRTSAGLRKVRPTDGQFGNWRSRSKTLILRKGPTVKKADNCGDPSDYP